MIGPLLPAELRLWKGARFGGTGCATNFSSMKLKKRLAEPSGRLVRIRYARSRRSNRGERV